MRIVVLGNGPFAVPTLNSVAAAYQVSAVVARPDKPQGKHQQIVAGPVAACAIELGVTLLQPPNVNDAGFVSELRSQNADILVVADFGQILNSECLGTTRFGGINVHASLLPKYRGAAPIAWAIRDGETQTGVSIIQMSPRLDAGGVILQRAIPIGPDENSGELEVKLAVLGAELALESIHLLETGTATLFPQDNAMATKAPRLKKEDGQIDWRQSATAIHNLVRAMVPWPIAHTFATSKSGQPPIRLQIQKTVVVNTDGVSAERAPGEVVRAERNDLHIQTGAGEIAIVKLQPAGKKEMSAGEFLRGHPLDPGHRFGE